MVNFDLTGKVALVTGGSQGIGLALGIGLAQAGATVCFNCTSENSIQKGLAAYREAGCTVYGYAADVTDEEQVKNMVEKIHQDVGLIDILVNNAGIIKRIPMLEKGHGKIINICSMMSELGRETVSAYAAAKGGLKMLTKNIASEYGKYNIQCNGLGPGYIATPLTEALRTPQEDGSRHPFDAFLMSKTPAERWGTPEDLAGPAVFLASDASNFVNGHILYVDGGILAYIGKQP